MFYVPSSETNLTGSEASQPERTSPDYETELKLLCSQNIDFIRNYVLLGNLRSSRLRSFFWRILLGAVSPAPSDWLNSVRSSRMQYDDVKNRFTLDPHQSSGVPDDNPLSQDTNSVWFRYFCDKELKRVIRQDVVRTSPDRPFFQLADVQEIMVNVLFVYARLNPNICYQQGMHEILATILYVMHEDCQNFSRITEIPTINSTMCEILDVQSLEKDAFCLFSCIMQRMEGFYQSKDNVPNASGHFPSSDSNQNSTAYQDDESGIGFQLTVIKKKLTLNDRQLDKHLEKLTIPFTAFGIRWLRLLFGREFAFADLLLLWDAIFAFNSNFILVNCILIAMLIAIRNKLLNSDYVQCLSYLMKYPDTVDVNFVIEFALHLNDARAYRKPPSPKVRQPETGLVPVGSDRLRSNSPGLTKPATNVKTTNNAKIGATKKRIGDNATLIFDPYSRKSFDMVIAEVKHMRVVMSLCKLKLYQYHDILSTAVDPNDVNAQHALTGIHELCTLLDIDHFSLKSSPNTPPTVEAAREAGEVPVSYAPEKVDEPFMYTPTLDAVAMYLPPPNSEIDMTVFSHTEFTAANMSRFPSVSPDKLGGERD